MIFGASNEVEKINKRPLRKGHWPCGAGVFSGRWLSTQFRKPRMSPQTLAMPVFV